MALAKPAQPIRLYGTELSGHTHRVRLFLSLLRLPCDFISVDMKSGEHRREPFLTKNPLAQVPVLEDGDVRLADSNAMLVYLALKYGEESWLPRDPLSAAHVQRWFSLAAGEILRGPGFARLVSLRGAPYDVAQAQALAKTLFEVLDAELAGRQFALGATPTVADVSAYTYIKCAPEGGITLAPYTNIRSWLARVEALPHFVPMASSRLGLLAGRG